MFCCDKINIDCCVVIMLHDGRGFGCCLILRVVKTHEDLVPSHILLEAALQHVFFRVFFFFFLRKVLSVSLF